MCTKHDACRSTKKTIVHQHSASCASPKITSIKAATVEPSDGGCCSSQGCASGADPTDDEESARRESSNALYSLSWQIEGMDCPSCARKIETAIKKVNAIVDAKVLFATEKLVVQFNAPEAEQAIEQAVASVGFSIRRTGASQVKTSDSTGWKLILIHNAQIFSIASAMVFAAIIQSYLPQISHWIFVVTCLAGLYPIAKKAMQLAKSGTPFAIETLMSVAALGALYLGETVEAAMVLLLFLIGERLEAFAASRARSGVQALMALVPETATKIVAGARVNVAVSELQPGDVVEVSPGARLPADGQLHEVSASFDESALTGESLPVERFKGENVMAGAVVVDQVVRFTIVSKQGENAIDRILHLIEEAEARKAPLERFLDQFSRWYTPLMMVLSLAVVVIPPLFFAQPWETWVYRGLALLLIACPCALVISTPAAITSGLAAGARRGALIKGGAALEQLGKIETIAFDKTGTLTKGKPDVTDVIALNGYPENQLLSMVAAIEMGSSHPLATALVAKVESMGLPIAQASDKKALIGRGVCGVVDGKTYQALAPSKVTVSVSHETKQRIEVLESEGKTVVVALEDARLIGLLAWQDTLREDAKEAIDALHRLGISTIMLTGDNQRSAAAISTQLGIDFKASLLPQDKVSYIQQLAQQKNVAMVGDGINDAPAMKEASIGIAMGGGTDVALETADAAITHNRLIELATMVELSQATLRNIRQNVTLALGLKAVFLVTSLLGITGLWVAVLADSGATALVTLNALRLLKFKQ
ncbi:zinc/cadmium/mercury/lead-transporting ATPase [Vibrio aestuarianus]|uniref:P-type Zn(2+) transporter n=1 Tax=Vibrio aestuarianus TaxID=28171 RepID=A0ABM9FRP2_9VIBR|nr:zinc/cadmium/mercury/lead-transporting ATPase [Vibrio aestuarianus]MDE1213253.1 zinc/cadmium/mercury/lead-transporting ATPase [Vibrio aestuarianus]MDE1217391.1 zinc/cadmium/mercury/lead-transporting ATPase [Vibrio aestuarianus]MDE1228639.1 zinc/cadmium/mercury/lead-transporting ATPase [Vibrio aestuarianus]MDE1257130.1 zinc/cadmium/mercury/lead-transporting ATPase [Vibrio aestuarianus]MDE1260425.1 zinc/cadmium/mercury/lead-transporting ATPase [Vibrio aestuarianus]